jgi:hypothetical protein
VINKIKFKIISSNQIATIISRYEENFKNQFFNNISNRNKSGKNKDNSRFNFRLGNVDSRDKREKKRRGNRTAQQNLIYYNCNNLDIRNSTDPI